MDFQTLDQLAAKLMAGRKAHIRRELGFIYRHGKRVSNGVILLRRQVTQDEGHDDMLRAAALFHDVGKGIEPHNRTGAALARELLEQYLTREELAEVARLIEAHTGPAPGDTWARLLRDADVIDHFGTVEIGLSFQYGAYSEGGMEETLQWYEENYAAYAQGTRERLHFDVSRGVFDKRVEYTLDFVRRFAVEMKGEYA